MQGLDRAKIYCEVETDPLFIKERLKILFPESYTESLSKHTTSYEINKKNINKIKIEEKEHRKKSIIRIDFSYPRFYEKHNIFPLEDENKKIEVENDLIKIINQIIDYKIDRSFLFYDYFEFTIQEIIENFYQYHNIISLLYRGLSRKYQDINKVQYYNFSKENNQFYSTGFIFHLYAGWKISLYSKAEENNKKSNAPQIKDVLLRMEHKITKSIIKKAFKTNCVELTTLEHIKTNIKKSTSNHLLETIKEELEYSQKILETNFKNFTCRELHGLVRDNLEWVFDEKILDDIVTNFSIRGDRQTKRYRKRIRDILHNSQERTSPKRDFFKNLERLKFFTKHFILIRTKIKCNTKNHLIFKTLKR